MPFSIVIFLLTSSSSLCRFLSSFFFSSLLMPFSIVIFLLTSSSSLCRSRSSCSSVLALGSFSMAYFFSLAFSMSQALQRIFMPSSRICSSSLCWSTRSAGASESAALPYIGHSLSVLMWPYLWHLTQRTLRTQMPKGWSLTASSPLAHDSLGAVPHFLCHSNL